MEIEQGTCTLLVFTSTGGMAADECAISWIRAEVFFAIVSSAIIIIIMIIIINFIILVV